MEHMTHRVDFVRTPATTVAVVRFHVGHEELPAIGEQMERAFAIVMTRLGEARLLPNGPAVAVYHPVSDGFDVATGFHVDPGSTPPVGLERLDLDAVVAAHTTHVGPYSDLPTAYAELRTQAERAGHDLDWGGPMWEEYTSEPGTPSDQTRTEIFWPVATAD